MKNCSVKSAELCLVCPIFLVWIISWWFWNGLYFSHAIRLKFSIVWIGFGLILRWMEAPGIFCKIYLKILWIRIRLRIRISVKIKPKKDTPQKLPIQWEKNWIIYPNLKAKISLCWKPTIQTFSSESTSKEKTIWSRKLQ